jgi:hypothetical protein
MKKIALCLFLSACGATAKAVEHAEYVCLEADKASLEAKVKAGQIVLSPASLESAAIALSEGELVCAVEALSAKPVDAGASK